MPNPTYRSSASATNTVSGNSITIDKPSGAVENDLLVATINISADVSVSSTGWTLVEQVNRTAVLYKICGDSEGDTYTFNLSGDATNKAGGISCFYNVDTINPYVKRTFNFSSGTDVTASSITIIKDDSLLVFAAGSRATGTYTPPSGMSEAYDTGNEYTTTTAYSLVNSGATGDKTATCTASSNYSAYLLEFSQITTTSTSTSSSTSTSTTTTSTSTSTTTTSTSTTTTSTSTSTSSSTSTSTSITTTSTTYPFEYIVEKIDFTGKVEII